MKIIAEALALGEASVKGECWDNRSAALGRIPDRAALLLEADLSFGTVGIARVIVRLSASSSRKYSDTAGSHALNVEFDTDETSRAGTDVLLATR